MFDAYVEWLQRRGMAWFYGLTLGGGTALCLLTGWLWWHFSYLNPQTAFWDAVGNNLTTVGVTKHLLSADNSGQLDEADQITLGANNFVSSTTTVKQGQASGPQSTVVSQTIGTPTANFARYTKIDTTQPTAKGQMPDFKSVLGQWSRQDVDASATGSGSLANVLFDIVPIAHLSAAQRQQTISDLQRNNTYNIDFTKVRKQRGKGHLFYLYDASIAPDKYVVLLKQVDSLSGLNQLKNLDPSQYQGGQPMTVTIAVDAWAHQLSSITYTGSNRLETYGGWGVVHNLDLPANPISRADLQSKLNAILNGQ